MNLTSGICSAREEKGRSELMENNGSVHQLICQQGGTAWFGDASKRIDEKIERGREIRDKCQYRSMCNNITSQCAEFYPGCQDECRHFVNNDD